MKKVFLYLYPIEEYMEGFLFPDDRMYDEWNVERPLPILNECIQKRYRDNGYQVIFVLYPDKDIFGIIPQEQDRIIHTDILFSENSAVTEKGGTKKDFIPKYPNEQLLIEQLGNIDHLVIGGYHFSNCVKRVGEKALTMGMNLMIDLDLTDLFFNLYDKKEYFNVNEYSPEKFKRYMMQETIRYGEEIAQRQFNLFYSDPIYGFSDIDCKKK